MRRTEHAVAVARALLNDVDRPVWGYELTRRSGVPSGRLYPLLARMLEEGWLIVHPSVDAAPGFRPPRRYYRVTDEGRDALAALADASR